MAATTSGDPAAEPVHAPVRPRGELIAIGHFPPPVHGMAVAVETFVALLQEAARRPGLRVTRVNIASDYAHRSLRHHVQRARRFGSAVRLMLRTRGTACVYSSVDAGLGMLYTLGMIAVARATRTPLYLHHHAADYLDTRTARFKAVCALGSPVVCHLVGCERMAESLRRHYPRARQIEILPILYAVQGGRGPDVTRGRTRTPVVLGHLSNLSVAKGLESVFDTAELLQGRGVDCELLIAGPPSTEADRQVLEARLARAGPLARYLGPMHGPQKESFFGAIDVFVFPSRYRHESFGLAAGEALARGCPIVTFENACLSPQLVGEGGLVLPVTATFPPRAADWIAGTWADPLRHDRVHQAAARFSGKRDAAIEDARTVARAIVSRTLTAAGADASCDLEVEQREPLSPALMAPAPSGPEKSEARNGQAISELPKPTDPEPRVPGDPGTSALMRSGRSTPKLTGAGPRLPDEISPSVPAVGPPGGGRLARTPPAWGSFSAGVVLLGFLLPILFAHPTLASLGRLPVVLAWLLTAYAAGRIWLLMLEGREAIISLTFWLFIYVWLGLGALANTVSGQFPLFSQKFSDSTEVAALMAIMIGLAGYELGRLYGRSPRGLRRSVSWLNAPTVQMRRAGIVGAVGIAVVLYFTYRHGLSTRFSSRQTAAVAFFGASHNSPLFLQQNKASTLLQIAADWVLVFLALYLLLYQRRISGGRILDTLGRLTSSGRRKLLLGALLLAVVLADNPLANPRYRFGGIALALLIAVWPLSTGRRFRLVASALIVASLFVYPYAAAFRTSQRVLQLAPLNTQFRTSPDFAMFQQELNAQVYVQQRGNTGGHQLLGVLLGWIPRSLWPAKPGTTGDLVLQYNSTALPASMSIFGFSFVDGGYIWVFVVLALYGWASGSLEEAYLRRPRGRLSLAAAAGPLFAAFQVFLVRGDPQPAVGELAPVAILLLIVCTRPWRAAQRGPLGVRPTPR